MEVTTEPLFASAHAALVFAWRYAAQHCQRPLMNRLAAPVASTGKGLSGLDGAAQAGMIRAEVEKLGRVAEAVLIARVAPRSEPCSCRAPCCKGHKDNLEWRDAIGVLVDDVRRTALAGCTTNYRMRWEYVARYFTPKDRRESLDAMADKHDIHRQTASAQCSKVIKWLKEQEGAASSAIEKRLGEIGLVGDVQ